MWAHLDQDTPLAIQTCCELGPMRIRLLYFTTNFILASIRRRETRAKARWNAKEPWINLLTVDINNPFEMSFFVSKMPWNNHHIMQEPVFTIRLSNL